RDGNCPPPGGTAAERPRAAPRDGCSRPPSAPAGPSPPVPANRGVYGTPVRPPVTQLERLPRVRVTAHAPARCKPSDRAAQRKLSQRVLAEHLLHLVEEPLRQRVYLFAAQSCKLLQQLALLALSFFGVSSTTRTSASPWP